MSEKCISCGDSFDEVYSIANCEVVCDKCCPAAVVGCNDCEWYFYESEKGNNQ